MRLSVVIPVYNGGDFIQKSYDSILNQKVESFEIIYVDNNSTDNSLLKIEQLVKQDYRVKLLKQPKQGAAPARNLGIQDAKGDYVYVFDVDDEIYPKALNTMIEVLDTYPDADAVFGKMVKSYKGISETLKPEDETFEVIFKDKPYWGLLWFSSLKDVVGPPAFLYRKRVFKTIGLYNEDIRNNEDTALDIKLGMLCNIAFLDMYVYLYFKHASSTIQTSKRQMKRDFMMWPRLVKEHLPFYLNHKVPVKFKHLLFSHIFQSIGMQLYLTKGFAERRLLLGELLKEVDSIKIPFVIRFYLVILVLLPLDFFRKLYGYYLVPYVVKHL